MSKYISIYNDWAFKRVFGQEVNKDLLIRFINDVLDGEHTVTDLTFIDKERPAEIITGRGQVYDLFCKTDKGENIVVEMQNSYQAYFHDRAVYYCSREFSSQGERGREWNFKLTPVYVVCLLNFVLGANTPSKFYTFMHLTDKHTGEPDRRNLMHFIYLVLPLFKKKEEECETDLDRWIYILNNMQNFDTMPFTGTDRIFKRLEEVCNITSMSKKDREKYDESVKVINDNYAVMQSHRELGLEEGIAKGRAEGKLEAALNMKKLGVSAEIIVKATGLSEKEIQDLA